MRRLYSLSITAKQVRVCLPDWTCLSYKFYELKQSQTFCCNCYIGQQEDNDRSWLKNGGNSNWFALKSSLFYLENLFEDDRNRQLASQTSTHSLFFKQLYNGRPMVSNAKLTWVTLALWRLLTWHLPGTVLNCIATTLDRVHTSIVLTLNRWPREACHAI